MRKISNEILDKEIETKFLLWQALLTINGFIATIVVGLAAFGSIDTSPFWVKLLIELILIVIIISSWLIARIFYNVGFIYHKINEILKTKRTEELNVQKTMNHAKNIHSQMVFAEKTTLNLLIIIALILVVLVSYLLFFQKSQISSNITRHHWRGYIPYQQK